jgi:hypothetical protein
MIILDLNSSLFSKGLKSSSGVLVMFPCLSRKDPNFGVWFFKPNQKLLLIFSFIMAVLKK